MFDSHGKGPYSEWIENGLGGAHRDGDTQQDKKGMQTFGDNVNTCVFYTVNL